MDQHGNLKYYRRMDGNNFVSVQMAQLKALTSASIPISTKKLGERNQNMPNLPYLAVPGIVLLVGRPSHYYARWATYWLYWY
jgi:glc operon protein GlcG